ncbi:MAG: hypothetical protein HY301_00925 [Verrucomicrobia bacterium]|nr:hypothetical protein [Verrucomicrobiota bacterium]
MLKLQKFLLFAAAVVLIYFMATEIGEGSFFWPVMLILVSVCAVLFIALDRNIWLVIPVGLINPVPLTFLPVPFKATELAFLLVFLYLVLTHAAMRHQWIEPGPANIWVPVVIILFIVVNHQFEGGLGLRSMGSAMAGARRHALFFIGACYYLTMMSIWPKSRRWLTQLPGFYVLVMLIGALPNLFSIYFPNVAIAMGIFWVFANASDVLYYYASDVARVGLWGPMGIAVQLWLVSRYPLNQWFSAPRVMSAAAGLAFGAVLLFTRYALGESDEAHGVWIALCLGSVAGFFVAVWFWKDQLVLLLSFLALAGCGLSGFRSSIFHYAVVTVVAAVFCLRWRVLPFVAGLAGLMAMLIAGNGTWFELPDSMQRSLSFLPGRWDPVVVSSAQASTDFRAQIQELYLEKYALLNPWLGSGYKMMTRDVGQFGDRPLGTSSEEMEGYIRSKDFHIGWISVYDTVGIVGGLAFLWLCIYLLGYLYKNTRRIGWNRLSSLQVWVSCYLVDTIVSFFTIFGSLAEVMPQLMFGAGLVVVAFEYLPASPSGEFVYKTPPETPSLPATTALQPGVARSA